MTSKTVSKKPANKGDSLFSILWDREFIALSLLVLILLTTGTTFYHILEGWRWLDALYFSVTTLTTVGYGDFSPTTDLSKLFTIGYIFIGIGTILAFIDVVARHAKRENPIHEMLDGAFGEEEKK